MSINISVSNSNSKSANIILHSSVCVRVFYIKRIRSRGGLVAAGTWVGSISGVLKICIFVRTKA